MSPLVQYIIVAGIVLVAVIGLWRSLRRGKCRDCRDCPDSHNCSGCSTCKHNDCRLRR